MHLILYGEKVEGILQTYDLRYQERKTKKQESHSIQTLFLKLSIDQTKQFFFINSSVQCFIYSEKVIKTNITLSAYPPYNMFNAMLLHH